MIDRASSDAGYLDELLGLVHAMPLAADRLGAPVMQEVARALACDAAWVCSVAEDGARRLLGAWGLDDDLVTHLVHPGGGVVELCATTKRAEVVEPSTATGAVDRDLLLRTGASQLWALPLMAAGEVIGALAFTSRRRPGEPLAAQTERVMAILALAVRALRCARDDKLEQTMRSAHELADYLAASPDGLLRDAVLAVEGPPFDVREFFRLVAERARELVDADLAAIGVGTRSDRPFDPWVVVGVDERLVDSVRRAPRPLVASPLEASAIEIEEGEGVDAEEQPSRFDVPIGLAVIRSLLAVPLRVRGEVVGHLYLANKRGQARFGETDLHAVETLAALAGSGYRLASLLVAIEQERLRLLNILEAAPDGTVFVDARTGRILANRAFQRMLGRAIDPEKGVAQKLGLLCWPDGTPLTRAELPSTHALGGEPTAGVELVIVRPDGRRIPVSERAAPVYDADGALFGAVMTLRDISLQKEVERLREEFAAMVAHDLRNPIQSMLVQIQLLRRAGEEGKSPSPKALDRLERLGKRLARMAGDLLDSTRVELSRVRLHRVPVSVVDATQALVERMLPTLGRHEVIVDARDRPTAMLDPDRFEQILTNLIDNAAKYSDDGTRIRVRVAALDGGVEIVVRDEGRGISSDELPHVFDRFHQAERARQRGEGLGLGLYIVQGFVHAHGGQIGVESVVDRGTAFRVWLPATSPPSEAESSEGAPRPEEHDASGGPR